MFERFDICEAYLALEIDYNVGGVIPERGKQVAAQLSRIQFSPSPLFNGFESLTDNGKEIYTSAVNRWNLGAS